MKEKELQKTYSKLSGIINIVITLIFIFAVGFLGYKIYKISQYQSVITHENIQLKVSDESKKIESTIQFTNPVSTSEKTGRTDPMAPF